MTTSSNIIEKINNNELTEICYSVNIPITKEGLLINIAPPNKRFERLMPFYSCTFQGFRKLSNGETAEIEKERLIHEVGDWIIKVDHQQTERFTFDQVKELLQSKILEKRQSNIGELQVTFFQSVMFLESLPIQQIKRSFKVNNHWSTKRMK